MRNLLPAFVALYLVVWLPVNVLAQHELPDDKPRTSVYKLATGISYTAIYGDEVALKAKYFLQEALALETAAGMMTVKEMDLYQLYIAAIWQPCLQGMGLLSPYLGIGPGANFLHAYPDNPDAAGDIAYYGVIPYGLEYTFASIPVALSLDCKMPFVELNKNQMRQARLYTTIGFGVKLLLR